VEFDSALRLGSHVSLRAAGAFSDGKYADYPNGPCPIELTGSATTSCNLAGKPMPGLPRWSGSIGGEYRTPATIAGASGSLVLGADVFARTRIYGDATDSAYTVIPGYTVANATIGFQTRHWDLSLFVRNLFDRDYLQNVTVQAGNSGLIVGTPSDPRMIGVTLKVRS
jgi:iron complex outermembrane receptor protein